MQPEFTCIHFARFGRYTSSWRCYYEHPRARGGVRTSRMARPGASTSNRGSTLVERGPQTLVEVQKVAGRRIRV